MPPLWGGSRGSHARTPLSVSGDLADLSLLLPYKTKSGLNCVFHCVLIESFDWVSLLLLLLIEGWGRFDFDCVLVAYCCVSIMFRCVLVVAQGFD